MSPILKVEWTLCRATSPAILRPCARCGAATPFRSTDKFRLNANGTRLDAWLIYRCCACGNTWNRPVLERMPRSKVSKQQLDALQSNDRDWAARVAGEASREGYIAALNDDAFSLISRRVSYTDGMRCAGLIEIRNPDRSRVRLDQILSRILKRSRGDVAKLAETGVLQVQGAAQKAIRRPVAEAATVEIHAQEANEVESLLDRLLD